MNAAIIALMLVAAPAAPDTLVICPAEYRESLGEWLEYRREQGHRILVVDPPGDADDVRAAIRLAAASGKLKCLVLIGDVASAGDSSEPNSTKITGIPTNLEVAKINTRWGSEPTIATDIPYADLDGDARPDLTVGRIPVDSPNELRRTLRKAIRYERETGDGDWQRRLDIVAGIGGFGAVADALIEAAGRQVFLNAVPKSYQMRHTSAKTASVRSNQFRETACKHLCEGSFAWIYLGHGRRMELDRVPTPQGLLPILAVDEVTRLHCQQCRPLAVLVACNTGAFDAQKQCLAEELALAENGPVAVIAATRVTMPYGNTVFGYELLRACFRDRATSLGEVMRLAQCRTLEADRADTFRPSLDSVAQGLSPPPVDLSAERHEHVLMYHLFGDPLLRLRLAQDSKAPASAETAPVVGAAIAQ